MSRLLSERNPASTAVVTQLGLQGPTDQRTLNGVSAQPTARVLHAELESTAATDDAPVEDASHQQALQHGKGGTEQHKLQRQLGQRFRDLPDALTLLLPANGSPELAQPAANATAMTDAPAKLKADITPGIVTCLALPSQRYACGNDIWTNACSPANTPVLARQPELSSHMGHRKACFKDTY